MSALFLGSHLTSGKSTASNKNDVTNLWDDLSDEEKQLIQSSEMAKYILNYPKQGFSCAGSILSSSLKFLEKNEEISHAASSFGGGIGHGDLCGLFTGAHMAIGISAGIVHKDVKERQKYAKEVSAKFWDWWESKAPIHCKELRSQYDSAGFARMLQRVALQVEELIKPNLQEPKNTG